ncbi:tail fiber protein [Enterobacter hormaechei]|uniref:tail fiber protein n=1 Tax=Enterobacter hormaechei TaxID=158836 RepID=UPI002949F8C3|nr:tail fiber protein [Enterobacter hormaechei]MDV5729411.1 tail fiber protein [Enterobacter hormaechei]MDV5752389.1 tail fiber protein [Enterobacter hormaechei]MDV5756964.1 tail fiber protein [Enterobacter hormaechei]MDV5769603.1 tail fiber protein [Enterobacter hormaechei]MDV5793506.1 tail fiber protein [Enterobacter hormaechei]
MANNKVKHYRTKVAGRKPDPAKLEEGEIAINLTDKKVFTKVGTSIVNIANGADAIVEGGQTFTGKVTAKETNTENATLKSSDESAIRFIDGFDKEKVTIKAPKQTDGSGALGITVQNGSANDTKNTFVLNGDGTIDLPALPSKGTNATRKDYVDSEVKKVSDKVDSVNKTLNTKIDANDKKATDNLNTAKTEINARIDSLGDGNTELAKNKVSKAGDTMTGNLTIATPGDSILQLKQVEIRSNADNDLVIGAPKRGIFFRPDLSSDNQQMLLDTAGTLQVDRVLVRSVQSTSAGALTRKDYVDGQIKPVSDKATAADKKATDALNNVNAAVNGKVNKAGDTMTGLLTANQGVSVYSSGSNKTNGIYPGNGDGSTWETCNVDIKSWYGVGIRSDLGEGKRTVVINARTGDVSTKGTFASETNVRSPRADIDVIYRRNGTAFVAADGNLNLTFSSGSHPSGFKSGYLLEQIKGFLDTKPNFKQHLQKRNLNDVREPGFYHQDANANTPNLNYPENNAGSLEVYNSAGIIQVYRIYNTGRSYQRAFYADGPWTPWTRNFSYGDPALAVGYTGVSGLGNNSIAIGDNDTGFRQVGDGILEVVANSQRVGQFTTGHAYFDKDVTGPSVISRGGSFYSRSDGNSHFWLQTGNGTEKGVIYAGADKVIHYRCNGGLHVFEQTIQTNGGVSIPNNNSINFIKAGANPRNMKIFHAGDATRGGRLEITGESSYIAYFEERPNNSHVISFNGDVSSNGTITGANVVISGAQNGSGAAATRKDYVDGQVTAVRNIANGKWTWNQAQIDGRVTAISYTKAQSDAGYMSKTGAYTKAESDGRYALKGSVSTTGNGGDVGQFVLARMGSRDTSFNGVYTADGRYPLVVTDINGNEEYGRTIQSGNWKRLSGGDKRGAALWVRVS